MLIEYRDREKIDLILILFGYTYAEIFIGKEDGKNTH